MKKKKNVKTFLKNYSEQNTNKKTCKKQSIRQVSVLHVQHVQNKTMNEYKKVFEFEMELFEKTIGLDQRV